MLTKKLSWYVLVCKMFHGRKKGSSGHQNWSQHPPPPYPQPTRKALLRSPLPPLFQIFEIFQDLVWKGCLTCVVQVTREAIVKCKLYYSLPLPILCYKSIIIGSSPKCWWTQQCRFLKLQVNAMGHWSIFVWLLNSHVFSKLKFMLWMKFPF